MTRINFYLDDLTEDAKQRYVDAVEEETEEPFCNNEHSHEFNVEVTISEDGVDYV